MPLGQPFVLRHSPASEGADEKELKFRKLTPYDRAEVLRREKGRQRVLLRESLKDAGADKMEIVSTLRDFDSERSDGKAFLDLFDSVEGKADIFDLAACTMSMAGLGQPKWERAADAEALDSFVAGLMVAEQTDLAAELCGVTLKDEPAAGKAPGEAPPTDDDVYGGGDAANPTAGGSATIPPLNPAMPTSLATTATALSA